MRVANRFVQSLVALPNFAASGAIGTAAATVDIAPGVTINQTTANVAVTLPNPTINEAGHRFIVTNTGTVAIAVAGYLVVPDRDIEFVWDGTSWNVPLVTPIPTTIAGTAYTLSLADNGKILDCTNAAAITITVPNTLPVGFQVSITQAGAGVVSFVGSGGMAIVQRWGGNNTNGQWAKAGIEVRAINSAVLTGDVG